MITTWDSLNDLIPKQHHDVSNGVWVNYKSETQLVRLEINIEPRCVPNNSKVSEPDAMTKIKMSKFESVLHAYVELLHGAARGRASRQVS